MSYTDKEEYTVLYRCGRCKRKRVFISTRKFRVNANRSTLDIWLIYQCQKCRHTLNIPIFERVPVRRLPEELYGKFLANDEVLALQYGCDRSLFKRGHFVVKGG